MKVIFYIDGQNVHHTLKSVDVDSYCFKYRDFCNDLVKNWRQLESVTIKFYGAIYPRELDEYRHHRDNSFFDRLQNDQKIIVRRGKITYDRTTMNFAREKGVDVLLAVDLIIDGFRQAYDQAVIISDDTDLIPAVIEAKKISTGIKVHNLSLNPLYDFKNSCDSVMHLYKNKLKKYYTPAEVKATEPMLVALAEKYKKK